MALESVQVSVGTSATELADADDTSPQSVAVLVPSGGSEVHIGPSGVTTSSAALPAGQSITFDLQAGESLHGIVASGTQTVHVWRSGVG